MCSWKNHGSPLVSFGQCLHSLCITFTKLCINSVKSFSSYSSHSLHFADVVEFDWKRKCNSKAGYWYDCSDRGLILVCPVFVNNSSAVNGCRKHCWRLPWYLCSVQLLACFLSRIRHCTSVRDASGCPLEN